LSRYHASVAIPAFNEARRLPVFLGEVARLGLESPGRPVEFVVVDDGSAPDQLETHRVAVDAAAVLLARDGSRHSVRLVETGANRGKGAAVQRGWREADAGASWLGFLDADGAVPAREFWRLLGLLGEGSADADVLAGSRVLMAGRSIRRSTYRHLQGRVFATLVESRFGLGCYDTQCGVKFVRAAWLRPRLELLSEHGWLLDVELLAMAHAAGARLREEPIDWSDPGGSKVRFGVDAVRMFLGLRRIQARLDAAGLDRVASLENAREASRVRSSESGHEPARLGGTAKPPLR